jgi:hypothetical protein
VGCQSDLKVRAYPGRCKLDENLPVNLKGLHQGWDASAVVVAGMILFDGGDHIRAQREGFLSRTLRRGVGVKDVESFMTFSGLNSFSRMSRKWAG